VDEGLSKKEIKVRAGGRSRNKVSVKIGYKEEAYRAAFVEVGTSDVPAQPHLRPALDNNQQEILDIVGDEIWQAIENAATQ